MKVNDFFCGAGGFGLGFKNEGFEIAGAWDFDKYTVRTYAHNIGSHVQQADVSKMRGEDIPLADVWAFGFPCQDISIAGKQKGMNKGTRSGLFYEIMRLLDEVEQKPSIILAENVKNVRKFLPTIKEEYAKAGYVMYAKLYNSKYWGVPQNRERWFILGVRKDLDKGIFRWEKQQEEHIPKLSSILESEVDEKYYINAEKAKVIIGQALQRIELKGVHACITPDRIDKRQNGRRAKEEEEPMFTLTSQDRHGIIEPCLLVKQATKKGYTEAFEGDSINISHPESKTRRGRVGKQVAQTLLTGNEQVVVEGRPIVAADLNHYGNDQMNRVYSPDGIAPTALVVSGIEEELPLRIRKLTPREYARLQGFPESFEQVVSNSQFYKQMGNAVTVNVAQSIARSIRRFLV